MSFFKLLHTKKTIGLIKSERLLILKIFLILVLTVICVFFNFSTPLSVATGVVYILLIFSAFLFRIKSLPFIFALFGTLMIGEGYFLISQIEEKNWINVTNRFLSIFVLWVVAFIVYRQIKISILLERKVKKITSISDVVLDTINDGVVLIDEKGLIISVNTAIEALLGYDNEALIGKNIKILIPYPYKSEHDNYLRNYLVTGERKIIGKGRELVAMHKKGFNIPIELAVNDFSFDGKKFFVGTLRDISIWKKAEKKLKESNEDLELFAYAASHDLKSPLRAIYNLSQWLCEDIGDKLIDEHKKNLILIHQRAIRLEKLLDDLFEYSRASNNINDAEILSAKTIVSQVVHVLDVPEGITIKIDDNLKTITTYNMPLKQVFHNLINNAIKHHDKTKGTIDILGKVVDNQIQFIVSDDGPGISKKYHTKIFEMFQTLKSRDEIEGSGMGLSIVKKIISRCDCKIWLESKVGLGTKVYFTWPNYLSKQKEVP